MTAVLLTVKQMVPKYPPLPPTAASMDIGTGQVMTVVADGVTFPCTGQEIILVLGGAAPHALTVKSNTVGDPFKRTGDIVYTVGAGLYSVLPQIQPGGFMDPATGLVNIISDAGGTDVKFWCIRLAN